MATGTRMSGLSGGSGNRPLAFWLLLGTPHATRRSADERATNTWAWIARFLEQYIEGCKHDAAALTQGAVKTCAQGSLPFTLTTRCVSATEISYSQDATRFAVPWLTFTVGTCPVLESHASQGKQLGFNWN